MNCSVTEMAHFLGKKPLQMQLNDQQTLFFARLLTYKHAIYISDPYDTDSTMNDTSIAKEYEKVGVSLCTPDVGRGRMGNIKEQIRIATQNLHRVVVNPTLCQEFISAMQNARFPERAENSNSTSENLRPVHDFTSHFRTSFEYLILFLTQEEKKNTVQEQKMIQVANPIT